MTHPKLGKVCEGLLGFTIDHTETMDREDTILKKRITDMITGASLNQGWLRASLADIRFSGLRESICDMRSKPEALR